MKFRARNAVALTALAALTVTGCSTGDAPGEQDLVTDPSEISGEITFSTWWAYADQELVDGFSELYPEVDVKLEFTAIDSYSTKLQALASSDDLPDVFAVQNGPLVELAAAGRIYDLNEALDTEPYDGETGSWRDSFVPALLAGANAGLERPEDETWGVPFNAISIASVYNQEIFEEVGVEPPTSYEGLLANCEALSEAGYIPMSLTGANWIRWWPRLAWDQTMQGGDPAEFSVDDPEYIRGFEIVEEMAQAGCWDESQVATDIAGETSLFLQGETAQFVSVPENFLQSVVDGAEFELGSYVLPALDGQEPNRTLGGGNANVIAVDADSDNLAAAVAFAKYLTSEAVQTRLAETQFTIPAIDVDLDSSNPLMASYLEAAGNGFINQSEYMPAFSTAGDTALASEILPSLILGRMSAEDAARATADLFQ